MNEPLPLNKRPLLSYTAQTELHWKALLSRLDEQFGGGLDLQGVLFLVGIQELGLGYRKFTKDQKLEVLHIAICTLLEPYGYYTFEGRDADGFPHWNLNEKLPPLGAGQQMLLVKQALLDYFEEKK